MGKIIAVCSGCGGIGKSTVSVLTALAAQKRGLRTILLDASGAARACDLLLGLESVVVVDMMDVVRQQASIQSGLYCVPDHDNMYFACASLYDDISLNELSGVILALRAMSDLLVLDLPTGPVKMGKELLDERDALFLLTRPDDISIRALERTMSIMSASPAQHCLIINRIDPVRVKKKTQYAADTVEMLLDMPASCVLYEDIILKTGIGRGKNTFEHNTRIRMELNRLLEQVL